MLRESWVDKLVAIYLLRGPTLKLVLEVDLLIGSSL